MQQSRRNRINADQGFVAVLADNANPGDRFHDANVTSLGDHISRHSRQEPAVMARARNGSVDVVAIAHDRRDAPLAPKHNRLLAGLNATDYAHLLPYLESVSLPRGWVVCEAGSNPDYVYFPTTGVVSMMYELQNGTSLEVAVTGNDGVVGVPVYMGGGTTTSRAVVRNAGHGYRIRAGVLKTEFETNPRLRQPLLRYAQALISQMAQTAVCRGHHSVEQQFCRLLLVSVDRLPSNELALTQDTIANLLGVRRESITAAAGNLQTAGLILCHRGRIAVVDRPGLEARVCECYAVVKTELDRLMVQPAPVVHAPVLVARDYSSSGGVSAARAPVERFRLSSERERVATYGA